MEAVKMNQRSKLIYEVSELKKEYGKRLVLQIRKLQFHPGTIYGIIGAIGSGKSTLLRLLAGKEKQTSGILNYDSEPFSSNWLGKIKGNDDIYLASVEQLPESGKIKQIVKSIYPKKLEKIKAKYFNRGVQKAIWDQTLSNLSPGEIAWLNKILAVESDPRVLLIDDYGTLMDDKMELDFRKQIKKMNRELGTTIILAAPTDFQIKKFAAVLIHLDNGHVSKIRPGTQNSQSSRYPKKNTK